ncbi:hypothetical protein ACW73O_11575 [Faecalibacterium prausnitzii]
MLKDMTSKYTNEKGLDVEALEKDFPQVFAEQIAWNVGIDSVVGIEKVLVSINTVVVVSKRTIFQFVWDQNLKNTYINALDVDLIKFALEV